MRFLLDTCTLLWLTKDADDLSARAREVLVGPGHEFVVSVASIWEIANKISAGKLPAKVPLDEWTESVLEEYGFESLQVDLQSAFQVSRLPPIHRDPFDRMLVAQAMVHGLVLLTPDKAVRQYPTRTYW
jgi:PIN domain nuclease of toxin-antitoxin system